MPHKIAQDDLEFLREFIGSAGASGEDGEALGPARALRTVLDAVPHMVWSTRPDGFHDFYNQRWYDFTGVPSGSTDGEGWNGMFHPEDQERAWAAWRHSLATGEPYEIEYRLRHHGDDYRWTLGRALPIRDNDGKILRWFGTCTDIDDLKRAEAKVELIAGELAHRIANIFAVVLALLSSSARHRPDAAGFARDFGAKVHALSRAHGLVRMQQSGTGGQKENLLELLESLAAPYQLAQSKAVVIAGDDVVLGIKAAAALALVVHELATNALKYGALSLPDGRVILTTLIIGDNLQLDWVERGGPPVEGKPQHTGFGTEMKRRAAALQLRGEVVEDWDQAGLRATMTFPVAALAL